MLKEQAEPLSGQAWLRQAVRARASRLGDPALVGSGRPNDGADQCERTTQATRLSYRSTPRSFTVTIE